jgi:hypothetical protein
VQWGRVRDLNTKELNGELQLPSLVVKKLLEACTEAALISTSPGIPVHVKSVRRNDAHLIIWEWQTTPGQDLQISPTSAMSRGKYAQQVGALIGVELTLEFESGRIICCWP